MSTLGSAAVASVPAPLTARTYALPYPAMGVSVLLTNLPLYLSSIDSGIALLRTELATQLAICGDSQRYLLAGCSQGAMVVHQTLQLLARDASSANKDASGRRLTQRVIDHIDGAGLIADGTRVRSTSAISYGSARVGAVRIATSLPAVWGGRLKPAAIPGDLPAADHRCLRRRRHRL